VPTSFSPTCAFALESPCSHVAHGQSPATGSHVKKHVIEKGPAYPYQPPLLPTCALPETSPASQVRTAITGDRVACREARSRAAGAQTTVSTAIKGKLFPGTDVQLRVAGLPCLHEKLRPQKHSGQPLLVIVFEGRFGPSYVNKKKGRTR
jgi:hypothetical protein